jgi:hypothetical protein
VVGSAGVVAGRRGRQSCTVVYTAVRHGGRAARAVK